MKNKMRKRRRRSRRNRIRTASRWNHHSQTHHSQSLLQERGKEKKEEEKRKEKEELRLQGQPLPDQEHLGEDHQKKLQPPGCKFGLSYADHRFTSVWKNAHVELNAPYSQKGFSRTLLPHQTLAGGIGPGTFPQLGEVEQAEGSVPSWR